MRMPVTPDYTTYTLKCPYAGPRGTHVMTFYGVTGVDPYDVITAVRRVITAMVPMQYDGTVWGSPTQYYPNATFGTIAPGWSPIESTNGVLPLAGDPTGKYLNFVGRSGATGVRGRLYMYNSIADLRTDMRWDSGENQFINDIWETLNQNAGLIGFKDGTEGTWKTYANVGVNDYWTRRDRVGT